MTTGVTQQTASRAAQWLSVVVAIAVGLFLAASTWFYARFPYDDAYIFMRIARQFAEHGVPYFNANEPVMGHSSHLWLWLLTVLFRLFGAGTTPVVVASAVLLVTCFVLGAVLLTRRWQGSPLLAVLGSGVVTSLFLMPISVGLMETPLAVAMLLGTMLALDTERERWAGFLAGLSLLARYELVLVVIFTLLLSRRRRDVLLGLLAPVVAFLGFTLFYFGTVIPQTVLAKRVVYSDSPTAILSTISWPWAFEPGMAPDAIAVLLLLLAASFAWAWRDRARGGWPAALVLVSVAVWCAHLLSRGLMFHWYWALATYPLALGVLAAARRGRERALALGVVFCLGPLTLEGARAMQGVLQQNPALHSQYQTNLRVQQYLDLGRQLKERAPDVEIMTNEIGGLGWALYPNRLIDGVGLITPDVLKHHPMRVPEERGHGTLGCIPPRAVVEHQPAVVVSLSALSAAFRKAVSKQEIDNFILVDQWPAVPPEAVRTQGVSDMVFGGTTIDVYARRPTAAVEAR